MPVAIEHVSHACCVAAMEVVTQPQCLCAIMELAEGQHYGIVVEAPMSIPHTCWFEAKVACASISLSLSIFLLSKKKKSAF
ncbi:hypothetical protein AMTRI_Chr07g29280 [Amborella trichopoda]